MSAPGPSPWRVYRLAPSMHTTAESSAKATPCKASSAALIVLSMSGFVVCHEGAPGFISPARLPVRRCAFGRGKTNVMLTVSGPSTGLLNARWAASLTASLNGVAAPQS